MKYVTLLRGINVGKKQVKMEILKKTLEQIGFTNVKTLVASGNVVFETNESDQNILKTKMEEVLNKTFGFPIPVILRTFDEIKKLVDKNPFVNIDVTPNTRLYVTFLTEALDGTPEIAANDQFKIIQISKTEILSVIALENNFGTVDFMSILEKEFGKNITTRNWNTIQKIAAL